MVMLKLTEELMIGNKVIDRDHQGLIDIINRFLDDAKVCEFLGDTISNKYHEIMHNTLKDLVSYTREHFEREEQIQRECMYEYHEMHKREHRALVAQVEEMARDYFVRKTKKIDLKSMNELNEFMKFWLMNHIKKFDTNLRPWVADNNSGALNSTIEK
jgi:hemerythrin